MKAFIQLRQQMGFCQEDMACAFGVSRPKLVRAEGHRGTLPTNAYHKMKQLNEYLAEAGNTEDIEVKEQQNKLLSTLKKQREDCIYNIKRLQRSLMNFEEAYRITQNGLKILAKMETDGEEYPTTYIPSTRSKLEDKLAKCSPVVTIPIKIRLEGLLAEEKYLDAEIGKMEMERNEVNEVVIEPADAAVPIAVEVNENHPVEEEAIIPSYAERKPAAVNILYEPERDRAGGAQAMYPWQFSAYTSTFTKQALDGVLQRE